MSNMGNTPYLDEPWCDDCPLRDLLAFDGLTEAELALLQTRPAELQSAPAGTLLIREGDPENLAYFLATGWVLRSKLLPNGRQVILQLHLPGDLIGLGSAMLGAPPHYSATALTAVTYRLLDRSRIAAVFMTAPMLARKLTLRLVRRERILDYRLLNLAARPADERLATMLLYVYARLRRLRLLKDDSFSLPLSQQQIADAIGAHVIHVNRILQRLRGAKLVTLRKGIVRIHDLTSLQRFGCFCAGAARTPHAGVGTGSGK